MPIWTPGGQLTSVWRPAINRCASTGWRGLGLRRADHGNGRQQRIDIDTGFHKGQHRFKVKIDALAGVEAEQGLMNLAAHAGERTRAAEDGPCDRHASI